MTMTEATPPTAVDVKVCECGCGLPPKPGNRFLHGHNGRRPDPDGAVPLPAAETLCAICQQPTTSRFGVCSRSPECVRELHLRRYAEPARRERMKATDVVWKRANPDKV